MRAVRAINCSAVQLTGDRHVHAAGRAGKDTKKGIMGFQSEFPLAIGARARRCRRLVVDAQFGTAMRTRYQNSRHKNTFSRSAGNCEKFQLAYPGSASILPAFGPLKSN